MVEVVEPIANPAAGAVRNEPLVRGRFTAKRNIVERNRHQNAVDIEIP